MCANSTGHFGATDMGQFSLTQWCVCVTHVAIESALGALL
jgi:hypothetical protein